MDSNQGLINGSYMWFVTIKTLHWINRFPVFRLLPKSGKFKERGRLDLYTRSLPIINLFADLFLNK